jgi:transcription initiation factor TFIID TATA-box-binding protein
MTIDDEIDVDIEVQNVVVKATFGHRFDLDEIAASLSNVEINPEKYNYIIYRMDNPEVVILIYASGVMVTVSARSKKDSIRAIQNTISRLSELWIRVHPDPEIEVRNILAKVTLPGGVNIELAAMMLEDTMYEPEQFPGLIYKPSEDIGIIIHHTGNMIVTGAKTEHEMERVVKRSIRCLRKIGVLDGS